MKLKLVFLLLLLTNFVQAQRYKILEGDLDNIKDLHSFRIEFDYSQLVVHGFESEEAFLKEKMEKRKNKPEKAEKFEQQWFSNRDKYYHPAFIEYFNNQFKKEECKIDAQSSNLIKMNVIWIYPAYAIEPAKISAIFDFYDSKNPTKKLLSIQFTRVIGFEKGNVVANEYERVIGAYEKIAKNLALQMKRVF